MNIIEAINSGSPFRRGRNYRWLVYTDGRFDLEEGLSYGRRLCHTISNITMEEAIWANWEIRTEAGEITPTAPALHTAVESIRDKIREKIKEVRILETSPLIQIGFVSGLRWVLGLLESVPEEEKPKKTKKLKTRKLRMPGKEAP